MAKSSMSFCRCGATWPPPRRFFARALRAGTVPVEVTTDRAPVYPRVPGELVPSALHTVEQHANNPVEADHGRLKARLRRSDNQNWAVPGGAIDLGESMVQAAAAHRAFP